jgi:4'-phosphopantetheinyl transferase
MPHRTSVQTLDRDRVDVWLLPLSADVLAGTDSFDALLSDDERSRAARFVRATDRARFVMGRAGLRLLLGEYLGADARALAFAVQPDGKPTLMSTPSGVDVQFNLSHSEELIAWAVGCERAVGVDVEHIPRLQSLSAYPRAFLSLAEEQVLAAMSDADRVLRMTEYWTLKEACVKATGTGLRSDVTQLTFDIGPDSTCRLTGTATEGTGQWEFRLVRPRDDYVVALCAERAGAPLDVQVLGFVPTDWRKKSTI